MILEYTGKICVKYQETFERKKKQYNSDKKKSQFFFLPLVLFSPGVKFTVGLGPRVSSLVFVSRRSIKM